MTANNLLLLVGFGFFAALAVALIAWTIRSRREEFGEPPPARMMPNRNISGRIEDFSPGRESTSVDLGGAPLITHLLRGIVPALGDLSELSEEIRRREADAGRPLTADEKKQAACEILEALSRRHPENALFRQMLESLRQNGGTDSGISRDL